MSITNFPIISLILVSITILLLFRFFSLLADKLIIKITVKHWAKRALFAFELIVWFVLIYQFAEKSIDKRPVLSVIMILLLVFITTWSFWFILRDYLAGIYIRISGRFKLHETIAFNDSQKSPQITKGKLIRFAIQNMVLEMQNHTTIEVPYNKLFNKKIERFVQSFEEEFKLLFEIKNSKDKENLLTEVNKQLLEIPWVNHNHEAKIDLQEQQDGTSYLKLKIILHDKKYRNRIGEILKKDLGK